MSESVRREILHPEASNLFLVEVDAYVGEHPLGRRQQVTKPELHLASWRDHTVSIGMLTGRELH